MNYLYIFATLFFTVYGQIILKWRITKLGWSLPQTGLQDAVASYITFLFDPFILSGFVSAFVASVFWMIAMTKFEITVAYPFMSLAPAIVFILGVLVLHEPFTIGKIIGLLCIMAGIVITVKF
ncbi:MAG TPA: EamA family transporter [Bacteroidales bacterium]|nr:EamA family transporter [Bacteroidales bacterium]